MKKKLRNLALILLCAVVITSIGYSQSTYNVKETKDSDIKLLGTSSLHDWEMDARSSTGEAQFIFNENNKSDLISIKSLSFALKVVDLKSDSKGLDKNAYEALKSDTYKDIRYQLTSSTISPEKGGYLIKSNGNLTIAGVTKEITMDVHGEVNEDGTITSKGSYKLNMTDYNVKPPSFMWGAMKTGDAITLNFKVVYKKGA
jgi:polyisoprenoid-binding protein YceI